MIMIKFQHSGKSNLGRPMGCSRIRGKSQFPAFRYSTKMTLNETYAPDYLNGDPLPPNGNVTPWAVNHTEAVSTPPILAVIRALKSHGVKKIAATGYCFGGELLHSRRPN